MVDSQYFLFFNVRIKLKKGLKKGILLVFSTMLMQRPQGRNSWQVISKTHLLWTHPSTSFLISSTNCHWYLVLHIPYNEEYMATTTPSSRIKKLLITVIHHQNIIGWDLYLKGFIFKYWYNVQWDHSSLLPPKRSQRWDFTNDGTHLSFITFS